MDRPIAHLAERGQAYVEHAGTQLDGEPTRLYAITGQTQKSADQNAATELTQHDQPHPAEAWLDRPLYIWNGSIPEPEFTETGNPLVNTSECSAATVDIGVGIIEGRIPAAPEIKEEMLDRIGATFFAGASPRLLVAGSNVDFVFRDNQHPSVHALSRTLFYEMLAKRQIPAFDVHDIAHHGVQVQRWPVTFSLLGAAAYEAFKGDETGRLEDDPSRHITRLALAATFEESILSADRQGTQLFSFGCLNWLSPRGTPVESVDTYEGHRWHSLYGLMNLYRAQGRAAAMGMRPDWLERLGYEVDDTFKELAASSEPDPLARLGISANEIEVRAPQSVDELFNNARRLLQEEGLWNEKVGTKETDADVVTVDDLSQIRERHADKRIAFASGVFDLIHAGHLQYLSGLKEHGEITVVMVKSDERVRDYKDNNRPIIPEADRARMVAAIKGIDYVFISPHEPNTPPEQLDNAVLDALRPDIIYSTNTYWRQFQSRSDMEVIVDDRPQDDHSTTSIIRHVVEVSPTNGT